MQLFAALVDLACALVELAFTILMLPAVLFGKR